MSGGTIGGLVSLATVAIICLVVIAIRRGFLVTALAAMCGAALGFVGAATEIVVDIITAIDAAVRSVQ